MNGKDRLDALLRDWPALGGDDRLLPPEEDAAWDARAEAIVAAARDAHLDRAALDLAFGAPNLQPEPGEPRGLPRSGELVMSSESDGSQGSKPASMPPNSSPNSQGPNSGRPRQSLREIAEKASQTGRSSFPGSPLSTPLPGRASPSSPPGSLRSPSSPGSLTGSALATPRPALSTPLPSPSVKRPVEAGSDDSGVVDLKGVNAAADANARAAAEKAKPGEASLFEDDAPSKKAVAAVAPIAPGAAAKAAKDKPKAAAPAKSGSGATVGIVIAIVGVAAAVAIWQVRKGAGSTAAEESTKPAVTAEAPKPGVTAAPGDGKPAAVAQAPSAAAEPGGLDPNALGEDSAPAGAGRVKLGGPLPKPGASAAPSAAPVAEVAKPSGSVGSLNEEIEKAAGGKGKTAANAGDQEPAGAERSKTLPERPSQGAVQAAIGQVLGSAKACVSEADEATRATVTFKSSGDVAGVTVTGWASANGKSGCVVSALKGAKVGAFSDGTYSFPVTIRP